MSRFVLAFVLALSLSFEIAPAQGAYADADANASTAVAADSWVYLGYVFDDETGEWVHVWRWGTTEIIEATRNKVEPPPPSGIGTADLAQVDPS